MAAVTLKNVYKVYGKDVEVVKDFNLEIQNEEFLVLVGPSGCGKSTTLRMIAGLEEITHGEIYIDGKLVNDVPPKDRDIAMVFQNYALYPHMSVFENMAFGLKLRKYPKKEIVERVNEAAKILGLGDLLKRKPKELSGGQRQRVALGRTIVRHPKVFLFDEPLSNLDAKLRVQMRTEISKLHNKFKYTMIYVTHDQTEAMTMGDRIVVMKDGIIHQIDTPINLYNTPANKFVGGFIGSPPMNFIEGNLTQADGLKFISLKNKDFILDLSRYPNMDHLKNYAGKKLFIGIRPESIHDDKKLFSNLNHYSEFEAVIEVAEPMGNETFLYLSSGLESNLLIRPVSSIIPSIGSNINLAVDLSKVHFFDFDSEKLITS